MSDYAVASDDVLDPKRPWITNPEETLDRMNWAQIFFNPAGPSPKLHFTRAWTMLFMIQLLVFVVPPLIALILNMAGGDGTPVSQFALYATPVVFIATTLMSYVIHSRRLIDARKSTLLALIVLVPLIISFGVFFAMSTGRAAEYDQLHAQREIYLADPDTYRAEQKAKRDAARAEAETAGDNAEPQQRRGPPGGMAQQRNMEEPLQVKASFVLEATLPLITFIIMFLSALVAIWSLTWVARVPYFGREPEEIDLRRPYERGVVS